MRGSCHQDAAPNLSDEMSEEKPHFKVTDRRLFNPDGTPRDIEREAETADESVPAMPTGAETATAHTDTAPPPAADTARPDPTPRPAAETASEARPASSQKGGAAEEPSGDPTAFANLVMFIASPAAAAMGMTEHPGLAPGELDLPLAKHCIDLLGTVQQKTRGNLGAQEAQLLEGLLAELRMQYISLTSTRPPAPPRGFSGSDITGGR